MVSERTKKVLRTAGIASSLGLTFFGFYRTMDGHADIPMVYGTGIAALLAASKGDSYFNNFGNFLKRAYHTRAD